MHSATAIQAFGAPIVALWNEWKDTPLVEIHWNSPATGTQLFPYAWNEEREIKEREMDFWGTAQKTKANKSADREGMTRLIAVEGAGRKKGESWEDNGTSQPSDMVKELKKSTQEVVSPPGLNSLNPQGHTVCLSVSVDWA